jgi:tetratricopeptide (TPR) repeat protein
MKRAFFSGAVLVAIASAMISLRPAPTPAPAPAPSKRVEAQASVTSYETAKSELAAKRKQAETMADAEPGAWSRRAGVAAVTMGYAQLTGDYDAYLDADHALTRAFGIARATIDDENVGPLLMKAQLDYELHRLEPALAALAPVEKQATYFHDQQQLAEIVSLRGAITFQQGKYDEGVALLEKSIALSPTPAHEQRLAIALAKLGKADEADGILAKTRAMTDAPRSLAWIELQRGKLALEHGKRDAGRRHLENALTLFPGWWQPTEHLAELDAREGHTDRAIAAYRGLVAQTNDPEFMDALAALAPDPALSERSNAIYEERLVKLPEASYGHALEHFLEFSTDAKRAVEIAHENVALRPNGEARTRLAQAFVRAGRITEARAEIANVLASQWVSAESIATAAIAARLAHDEATATKLETQAKAINPHALEELDWLTPVTST